MSDVVAFFDMDHTVIDCNSASRYARYLHKRGELQWWQLVRTAAWVVQYKLAIINAEAVTRKALNDLRGESEADMIAFCEAWFEDDIRQFITDASRAAITHHQEQGHRVVLLTAATPYVARPLSRELELDDFIATRLEVKDGHFTGDPVEPLCYGPGKIHWAEAWAEEHGADLERCYFYTDSFTDLPMLERVGHRVVVNPDPRLKRYARRNGLRIESWHLS